MCGHRFVLTWDRKRGEGWFTLGKASLRLRRITVSAIFLGVSLVLNAVSSFYIPLFGQNGGMRIGISGIFSMMPSFLFGPVYGMAVSGLSDLLGYLLSPTGPYLPLMTLAVAAGGFLRGALWLLLRGRDSGKMRITVAVFSAFLLALSIANIVSLSADGVDGAFYDHTRIEDVDTGGYSPISRMLITRSIDAKDPGKTLGTYLVTMTWGLMASAVLGAVLLAADLLISRRFERDGRQGRTMQLLIAMVVSGIIVTTLNTVVLRETVYASWKAIPFIVVWIPRVIEEILGNTVKAYFIAVLLGICNRQRGLTELVR